MVRTETPICEFDLPAINFKLKGVDEQFYDLKSLKGPNGLLIMFICNHCPYVKSIISRIIRDTKELKHLGVNSVGIMSNDPNEYEEDSFENMKKAVVYGSVLASFSVEEFGTKKLEEITEDHISCRLKNITELVDSGM